MQQSVYDFSCEAINGETLPLARFRGQALLIVNTASYCGLTPQYRGLEFLYREFRNRGFSVLGFPCNQLSGQEPRGNERISEFCVRNYGVSFPMFAKVRVNGERADPLYKFLKEHARGLFRTRSIKYNFTKFLVDRRGRPVQRIAPATLPRQLMVTIDGMLT